MTNATNWEGGKLCVSQFDSVQRGILEAGAAEQWAQWWPIQLLPDDHRPPSQHQVKSPFFPPTEEEQGVGVGGGLREGSDCCVQVLGGNVGSLLWKVWGFHGNTVNTSATSLW